MNKNLFLSIVLFVASIYSAENLPMVALPAQSEGQNVSDWGHEEFHSILPDHLIHLIMAEATLGNEVSKQGLRTEKRQADPKFQVQAVEGMLQQRGYQPNSASYQTFINNLVEQYNESIQNHAEKLALAETGFVNVSDSMISLAQRKEKDRNEELVRYNSLPFSTKFQKFAQPRAATFLNAITPNVDSETVKILNEIVAELRQLSIGNPEQVVMDALRSGVSYGLNMLKNYIKSIKQQRAAAQVKAIEDQK